MKITSDFNLDEIELNWLQEGIRNLVKREVSDAIRKVDIKSIIQKAVNDATKTIEVVHTHIKTQEVDHYTINKKTIEVPEIRYRREEILRPVIREQIHWVEKIKEVGDKS